jgi:colanic acid/amylovoran biosynthesis glycosyltransferase
MRTIAHFVSPYLFRTGSWIHAQLVHAQETRPIVLAHELETPEAFPFHPLFFILEGAGWLPRLRNRLGYIAGRYDPSPCLPILRRENAELIHAHLGWAGSRTLGVARAAGLPLVTSFYGRDAGILPRYPWWRRRFTRLFREGNAFLVEGPALGRRLESLGCPPEKIRVVHLGIDPERIPFRERRPASDGAIEILVSASLRPKKGVPQAVEAFAAVADRFPQARLHILGDGPLRPQVEHAIRRHRLAARVVLEGYVDYTRHLAALQTAHLFLAPSRTAPDGDTEGGAPVALIEAQAAGLPVVSTRHADIPEIVAEGAGLLSPEYDEAALAENLGRLLADPARWPGMGRAGRGHVERGFAIRTQVRRTEAIYDEILRARAPLKPRAASPRGG